MLLLLISSCTQTGHDSNGEAILEEAEKDYLIGDYIKSMKAIHRYIKATKAGEISSTPELQTKAYKFLGNIHLMYGDRLNASSHYQTAIAASEKIKDKEEKLKLLYNLVILHQELGNQTQVEKYICQIKNSKEVSPALRDYFYFNACGIRDYAFSDKRQGIRWMKTALKTVDDYGLEQYLKYNPLRFICESLLNEGRYDEALLELKRYEAIIRSTKEIPESELECAQALVYTYTMLGDNENSLKYQQRVEHLSDSLNDQLQFLKTAKALEETETDRPAYSRLPNACYALLLAVAAAILVLTATYFIHRKRAAETGSLRTDTPSATDSSYEKNTSEPVHHDLFKRIDDAIEHTDIYTDPELTVKLLAAMTGSNVKYVSQAVSSHTGRNFRSYLNARRVRKAKVLMSECGKETSIQEVARQTGFVSQSVFIEAFRRETGMTPSAYLKKIS